MSPALAGRFFTSSAIWEAQSICLVVTILVKEYINISINKKGSFLDDFQKALGARTLDF